MTLYDFDWSNDDPWISKGEHRAAAFMHWFLIILACGGARVECATPLEREVFSRFGYIE